MRDPIWDAFLTGAQLGVVLGIVLILLDWWLR
jgi:hypothetical protein